MAKQVINIGAAPNDGTGDYIRDSFNKVNQNFTDIYTNFATTNGANFTGLLYTDNSIVATGHGWFGTSNASAYTVGSNVIANSSGVFTTGTVNAVSYTVGSNVVANSSGIHTTGIVNAATIVTSGAASLSGLVVDGLANVSANASVNGTLYIAGNTTYVTNTMIASKTLMLKLANGTASAAAANGAGIVIGGTANLIYNSSNNAWQSNVNIVPSTNNFGLGNPTSLWNVYSNNIFANSLSTPVGSNQNLYVNPDGVGALVVAQGTGVSILSTTQATTPTSGALVVSGGIGVANNAYFGNNVYVTGTVNAVSYTLGGGIFVANTTSLRAQGAVINSTGAYISGLVNATSVNSASYTVGSSITVNSAGFYTTGTVNSASYTVGSAFVANASGMYTTGKANAASLTVGNTTFTVDANSAGIFATGTINAASHTVGSTFVANNTVLKANGVSVNSTGIYGGGLVSAAGLNISSVVLADFTGLQVSTNTFNLGTAGSVGNSTYNQMYTRLPNGFKMASGQLYVNSSGNTITFTSPFSSIFSMQATTSNTVQYAAVTALSTTSATIKTTQSTNIIVNWLAIGT
jgi:hypothetical protein